jgi:hypothetical protein
VAVRSKPVRPLAPRRRATPALRTRRPSDATEGSPQTSAPPPTSPADIRSSSAPGGLSRWGGDFLFLVFFLAALIMVVAVVLVGAVDQWWVLAIVQLLGTDG